MENNNKNNRFQREFNLKLAEWKGDLSASLKNVEDGVEKCESAIEKIRETMETSFTEIRTEIAMLKVKSGVWGALAGAIPVIIGLAIWFLRGK